MREIKFNEPGLQRPLFGERASQLVYDLVAALASKSGGDVVLQAGTGWGKPTAVYSAQAIRGRGSGDLSLRDWAGRGGSGLARGLLWGPLTVGVRVGGIAEAHTRAAQEVRVSYVTVSERFSLARGGQFVILDEAQ